MPKYKFTGTATQPQCNRKLCQFNKDQYCSLDVEAWLVIMSIPYFHVSCLTALHVHTVYSVNPGEMARQCYAC